MVVGCLTADSGGAAGRADGRWVGWKEASLAGIWIWERCFCDGREIGWGRSSPASCCGGSGVWIERQAVEDEADGRWLGRRHRSSLGKMEQAQRLLSGVMACLAGRRLDRTALARSAGARGGAARKDGGGSPAVRWWMRTLDGMAHVMGVAFAAAISPSELVVGRWLPTIDVLDWGR
ncbi:hypothetical protein ACLOJK_021640 [Asimina triloba]